MNLTQIYVNLTTFSALSVEPLNETSGICPPSSLTVGLSVLSLLSR